VNLWLKKRSIH